MKVEIDGNTIRIKGKFFDKGYLKISLIDEPTHDTFLCSVVIDQCMESGCLPMVEVNKNHIIGWFNRGGGKQFIE